jgi:hypothetical protein
MSQVYCACQNIGFVKLFFHLTDPFKLQMILFLFQGEKNKQII